MNAISVLGDLARAQLGGALIDSSHAQYDRLRRVNNALVDRQPTAIVRATSVSDVQKVVRIAAERGVLLAVRCGGHSFPGLSTCDRGIVLDLSLMKAVTVDPQARTSDVSGGALLSDVDAAGLRYGLVTPAGVISHTGVGGLTLGGGMGWLSRRFGLTIDNLIGVDIVTADARLVRAAAKEEPDLFWAVRGGGGNFGVVTTFKFRMHPLGPAIVRRWTYPATDATAILQRYREMLDNAPRELTTMFILMRGELQVSALWSGSTHGAAAALERAGRLGRGRPVTEGEMTFLDLQRISDERLSWGRRYYSKGGFLREIDEPAISAMLESMAAVPVPEAEVYCLQLGGPVSDIDESATPYSGRAGGHYWIAECAWDNPAEDLAAISWGRATADRLAAISLEANYVNEQSDTGIAERAYGEAKYSRLAHLKWKYDPTNLFRLNQNIEPRRR